MLDLYVSDFQDPENELPHPHVPQAQNNILDLMTFSGDAKAVLAIWPYIALKTAPLVLSDRTNKFRRVPYDPADQR